MLNKTLVVAKTNLRNIKTAYTITAVTMGCFLLMDIVMLVLDATGIFSNPEGNSTVSMGNFLYLLVILSSAHTTLNFRKMMNLGAKRTSFFFGCFANNAIIAAAVSLVCIVLYYTYDRYMISVMYKGGTLDVIYWFGWINNGVIVAFLQQFAFLLLFATFVHTLVAAQDKWYGWVADVMIIAIISVFTPIAPLRASLVWFFNLIIFSSSAFVQIAACIVLAAAIHSLNKLMLARKAI